MKLKQYIKHGAIVAALSATTIFAATAWPTTAGIENGQIIQAPTIRDGLQYLYERTWDFVDSTGNGNGLFTNQPVSIGGASLLPDVALHVTGATASDQYCDGEGENCVPGDALDDPVTMQRFHVVNETGNNRGWSIPDGQRFDSCVLVANTSEGTNPSRIGCVLDRTSGGGWSVRSNPGGAGTHYCYAECYDFPLVERLPTVTQRLQAPAPTTPTVRNCFQEQTYTVQPDKGGGPRTYTRTVNVCGEPDFHGGPQGNQDPGEF